MTKALRILILVLLAGAFVWAKEKAQAPGIGGITLGMERDQALKSARAAELFKGCEIITDSNSNALNIHTAQDSVMRLNSLSLASLKFLYNKKRTIQALNAVFVTRNADEVEAVYKFVVSMLGKPKTLSSETIGFKAEAEWNSNGYSATFFASDAAFETYLLVGYAGFVREEEARGSNEKP